MIASAQTVADDRIVINEVSPAPPQGSIKFVEIENRGSSAVDLRNWWICDQPSAWYVRLTNPPTFGGPTVNPGVVIGPGDFLVLHLDGPPPGTVQSRPNQAGTATHILNLGLPASFVLGLEHGNFSIWDQTAGDPNFPSFDLPTLIRDFVAWSNTSVYVGVKRGCVAAAADLWPPPLLGDCLTGIPTPVFVAVRSNALPSVNDLSINHNHGQAEDPSDYFIAPATEGERNDMPGDLDLDYDMDETDFDLFVECLGKPPTTPPCERADLDGNGVVDCGDWPLFEANWRWYSTQPPPKLPPCVACTPGDVNGDGRIDGEDVPGFVAVVTGLDPTPSRVCAADIDRNQIVDCRDTRLFGGLLLASNVGCLRGDVSGDGRVDGDDLHPFVEAVLETRCLTPAEYCAADADADGRVNAADVAEFVRILLGS